MAKSRSTQAITCTPISYIECKQCIGTGITRALSASFDSDGGLERCTEASFTISFWLFILEALELWMMYDDVMFSAWRKLLQTFPQYPFSTHCANLSVNDSTTRSRQWTLRAVQCSGTTICKTRFHPEPCQCAVRSHFRSPPCRRTL